MTWNYRIVLIETPQESYFELREVYYDNFGTITGYTQEGCTPMGLDFDELKSDLRHTFAALEKPLLREKDLP